MESGAKGCEVVVSGKLRGQRAKSMKFVDGLMIHAGNPIREYIDSAITHVHLRQGRYIVLSWVLQLLWRALHQRTCRKAVLFNKIVL